jgi:hypothetical protein
MKTPQNNIDFKYFMIGILKNVIGKLDIIEKIIKYDKYNNINMSHTSKSSKLYINTGIY